MHFRVFSIYRIGDIFLGAKISTILFGVLEIPDIFFLVNGRCWARAYV